MPVRKGHSPRKTLIHFGEEVTLYRYLGDTNRDGMSAPEFRAPETIWAVIRPQNKQPADFEIGTEGAVDAVALAMDVLDRGEQSASDAMSDPYVVHPSVDPDDRIIVDGDAYRATSPQEARRARFTRFMLVEDSRTDSDTGDGESGGGSGDDGFTTR